jgi:Fe2+ or Zn2+ uptake regulation protein
LKTQAFVEKCEQTLKAAGQRITQSRRKIAAAMARQDLSFSAKDIHEHLVELPGNTLELSTVYRSLEVFADHGLIHAVQHQGKFVICQSMTANQPTAHILMHCKSCGSLDEEIIFFEEAVIPGLMDRKKSFRAEDATIDLFGACSSCI